MDRDQQEQGADHVGKAKPSGRKRTRLRSLPGSGSTNSVSRARLEAELAVYEPEFGRLKALAEAVPQTADGAPSQAGVSGVLHTSVEEIEELIKRCKSALEQRDAITAWHCYKAARRTELYLLEVLQPEMLQARAEAIRQEARRKLKSSWRGQSIEELLKKCSGPHTKEGSEDHTKEGSESSEGQHLKPCKAEYVVAAAKILDEHHDNTYQKINIIEARLSLLSFGALLALVGWLLIGPLLGAPSCLSGASIPSYVFWLAVVLLGAVGAIVSGFIVTGKGSQEQKIPDLLLTTRFILARLALGSLTALAVSIFLSSELITLGKESASCELVFAAAFISGFSERLVLRAVEAAVG